MIKSSTNRLRKTYQDLFNQFLASYFEGIELINVKEYIPLKPNLFMENVEEHSAYLHFNEEELVPLLSLISNIANWENGSVSNALVVFAHSTNFLSVPSLTRIVDEHFYKMQPQKKTSLFSIPLIELLAYLHEAYKNKAIPVTDSEYYKCHINAGKTIGFDKNQSPTSYITVVRDKLGNITDAFPAEVH